MRYLLGTMLLCLAVITMQAQTATLNDSKIESVAGGYKVELVVTPKAATTLLTNQIKKKDLPMTITVGSKNFTIEHDGDFYVYDTTKVKSVAIIRKAVLADLRKELGIK